MYFYSKEIIQQKKSIGTFPSGRLQKGENLSDTLVREVKEEIGLDIVNKIYPFSMVLTDIRIPLLNDSVGLIFSIFRYNLLVHFQPILSNEHIAFGWFSAFEASQKLKAQYPNEFILNLLSLS
jgi:8-oxo-dGTP pyrophosphatase MutT (NUDIX family)